MRKLTPKQQRFVDEYLIDLNASAAAKRAGYSAKTSDQLGYQLLQKPSVAQAISEGRGIQAKRTTIDAEYVLGTIQDTVERCKQAKPVLDKRGQPVLTEKEDGSLAIAYDFDSRAVLKGCELLGRNLALWKDRVEHSGPDGKPIEVVEIPETERARRIAFLLSKATRETVQ